MKRKLFLQLISAVPLLNITSKALAGSAHVDVCKTQSDAEGPFYKKNAPLRSVIETEGETLKIEGRVFSSKKCDEPVANAIIDIWHCDHEGNYDLKGFKGRGQVKTDGSGRYSFLTILPPPYGSRPRHIHLKVRATGRPELTTQLYFKGDPNINNDFARDAEPARVISLKTGRPRSGVFDIYL